MMISIPLLHPCFGRSSFIFKNTFEATFQSETGDTLTPAKKGFFSPLSFDKVSFEETPVGDLPIHDLTFGGLADFRLLMDRYH